MNKTQEAFDELNARIDVYCDSLKENTIIQEKIASKKKK